MKIKIDISPAHNDHKYRGIGSYTKELINAYSNIESEHTFVTHEEENIDLVHYPYYELFSRSPKINKSIKTVVTLHDVTPLKFASHFPVGIRGKLNWYIQKKQLQKVDAILTDSNNSKNDIITYANVPESRVYTVYLAASDIYTPVHNKKIMSEIQRRYDLASSYILYVGDVNWNKNVNGLIKAFSYVHKKYSKINLVLVGSAFKKDIPQTKDIRSLLTELHLDKYVKLPGFVKETDMRALYSGASVYVQPSYYEGFGLPVLEAMRCGTLVVSSNEGSLPEIGGNAAFFTDAYDPEQMARDIEKVITLGDKQKTEVQQRSIRHAQTFNWAKTASETISVYEQVIQ